MRNSGRLAFALMFFGCLFAGQASADQGGRSDRNSSAFGKWQQGPPNIGQNLKYGKQSSGPDRHHKKKETHKKSRKKDYYGHSDRKSVTRWHGKHPEFRDPHRSKGKGHYGWHKPAPHYTYRGPTYIYVKTLHTPRYRGTYSYRGFFWPFINVTFIYPLSPRQIEHHHQAIYIALDASVGQMTRWRDGDISGNVVVLREGVGVYGNICREYRQTLTHRGRTTSRLEVSCLDRQGYWIST